jgi:DNA-binding CsgD family transcriptional regulator
VIIFYDRNQPAEFIYPPELEEAVKVYLAEEWWHEDIHALRALDLHMTSGDVLSDQSIVTPEEIETLPIYADFFRRVGFGWIVSNVMLPELEMFVGLSVVRAKEGGPFAQGEIDTLRSLGRHVEQALRVSMRLSNLDASHSVLMSVLDQIEAGVLVLDSAGGLRLENRTSERQFADHFAILDGRVVARDADEREGLEDVVDLSRRAADPGLVPRSCVLSSPHNRRIVVWAMPLAGAGHPFSGFGDGPGTLLLTMPVTRDRVIDPVVIRDVFGLSLGEARLASLVGSGKTVREAAESLGVTEGTARVVLKRVFGKLGVNRQAELVLHLSALGMGPTVPAPRPRRN